MTDPIAELRAVSCKYGTAPVLQDVSLTIGRSEFLIVVGPNGAGKTTLLRAIAGLIRPTHGTILVKGRSLRSYATGELARMIAYMPQSEQRDWPLTVEEAVQLGRIPHRGLFRTFTAGDREAADRALASMGLDCIRDRSITELSSGEWRRVCFARALTQEAQLLLLDEPTAGLDLKYAHNLLELIRRSVNAVGLTAVLSMHDLDLACRYASRIAVVSRRTVLMSGAPELVLTAEMVRRVYDINATVVPHPVFATPLVVPLISPHY